ncbi:serine palmitoyltransferase [Panacagrimonas perspica]|uniref:Serine palmitoyltransferase n=1 Tax=Panacagrimonas perspica TaxID=381431 RepID=A0A4R7P582_9GAMM|nr:aminotransferase class I/II-fold pyridoxal phosphate-dependent enzyme [Panacagrimonas perspica]TDU28955.1 serine palmitoyltransferase [Panacagrimonas perspica]THD02226.1 8-amino-7-oxononanoate synthase [Panacagrimonas perspica]
MSLFDKFKVLAELKKALGDGAQVSSVATPMDQVHSATSASIQGRKVVLAGTNNYLGLTFDERCRAAAIAAIEAMGTGTTGSRMASGNYAGHRDLEEALAGAFGWPSGIVFSTGYQANLGALSALASTGDTLVIDADSHASIHDACRLSQATTIRFRHNDPNNLERHLSRLGADASRALVVVESLYSVLGDRAPLAEITEITKRYGAWLIVDEAHSFGLYGARGLGICEELGLLDKVDFIVGTFSKSLGGVGGFCVSRHPELELIRMASRPYIFTASPPPGVIAATRCALDRVLEGHDLRAKLWRHVGRLYSELERLGYRVGTTTPGPVAALVFSEREEAKAQWQGLLDAGVYTNLMIPPATPIGTNIVRISLSAAHSDEEISHIIGALEQLAKKRPVTAAA